ncbi:MAG TPA: gamma-glutamylcyclotransferase family protein [Pyrinomonadaceae bacterium]|nr:gamma-glutamylcyclotransferase family protein [Pyrinomonadaceae bacterium]
MSQHLFLYGTLLPSEAPTEIASIVKRFRRLGSAHVRGRLYDFGEFPGAVLDPSSRTIIHGELVALPSDERILQELDRYEEFDPSDPKRSLFVRKKAKVQMANGSSREGWIYVYNKPPGKARLVRGGDYLRSKVAYKFSLLS